MSDLYRKNVRQQKLQTRHRLRFRVEPFYLSSFEYLAVRAYEVLDSRDPRKSRGGPRLVHLPHLRNDPSDSLYGYRAERDSCQAESRHHRNIHHTGNGQVRPIAMESSKKLSRANRGRLAKCRRLT